MRELSGSNYVLKQNSIVVLKGELGLLASLGTLSSKIPIARESRDSDNFDTLTVLLRKILPRGKIEWEKSGTASHVYAYIYRRLCLARTASDLRKEVSVACGDLYIRFARRCEPLDILDIRTHERSSSFSFCATIFSIKNIIKSIIFRRRRKYVKNVFLFPLPHVKSRENTHSVLFWRRIFPFFTIFQLSIEDRSPKILSASRSSFLPSSGRDFCSS